MTTFYNSGKRLACWLAAILLCAACGQSVASSVLIETALGSIEIELLEQDAPLTVANFLQYVRAGDYQDSFIHRSVPGFIIQGGSFTVSGGVADVVPARPPVVNEFGMSNIRGTVAMAKLGGDPDSATSSWFINLADNSENLDNQNGGFTVFGRVIGDGMDVADAIAALPVWRFNSPFTELPLIDYPGSGNPVDGNFVITRISEGGIPFNPGLNGSWFNEATPGQGFFLEVFPDIPLIFIAWFSWDTVALAEDGSTVVGSINHRWLTAQGGFSGTSATLDVNLTRGGVFDDPAATVNSQPGSYGTVSLTFADCESGTLVYDFFSIGLSGTVPLSRIADSNVAWCESLVETLDQP